MSTLPLSAPPQLAAPLSASTCGMTVTTHEHHHPLTPQCFVLVGEHATAASAVAVGRAPLQHLIVLQLFQDMCMLVVASGLIDTVPLSAQVHR